MNDKVVDESSLLLKIIQLFIWLERVVWYFFHPILW